MIDDVTWPWKVKVVTTIYLGAISRKRLEIESRLQWNAYSKCYMGHQMVTWPMTSRDPNRSRSWPRYIWSQIYRKHIEIGTWFQWSTNRKPIWGIESSRDRWRYVTLRGQGRDPIMFRVQYLENGCRLRVGYNGTPITNAIWGLRWSHDQWRQVTLKGKGSDPDIFGAKYLENTWR